MSGLTYFFLIKIILDMIQKTSLFNVISPTRSKPDITKLLVLESQTIICVDSEEQSIQPSATSHAVRFRNLIND